MTLTYDVHGFVPMDEGTYMSVSLKRFSIADVSNSDRDLLQALGDHGTYVDDYESLFEPDGELYVPHMHGRWWRVAISAENFQSCTADEAAATLRRWATVQDWAEPDYVVPDEVMLRLDGVIALLTSGSVYRLVNPDEVDERPYPATGGFGFYEFVVIDRDRGLVHLIVASDD